jgi:microcystin degradation protein MlrC
MKIVVGGFHQESNSFSAVVSTKKSFTVARGTALLEKRRDRGTNLSGILAALDEAGAEIVPAVSYTAQSSGGPVERTVVYTFLKELLATIDASLPVDGVFLDLHGATEVVGGGDCCGMILESIRKHVGPSVVLTANTDLHANITDKMAQNADVISGYQTYPHQDFYQTGYRSARQGLMLLQGTKLYQARVRIPMIVPAEAYNTNEGSFAALIDEGKRLVDEKRIVDFSIYQMQPWLNVKDAGSTVLVTAEKRETAARYARELAHRLFDLRREWQLHLYTVDEVIDAAKANRTDAPVVLVDSADSPNAGSSADSSFVLSRMLERKETLSACMVISDTPAAEHAFEVGVGNVGEFTLGGTLEPRFQKSIRVRAYVKSLHDGKYFITTSQRGIQDVGKTAVLQIGNIDLVVYTRMKNSSDLQAYRAFGIEPSRYRLVMVKSATQYKVAYSAFTTLFYPTDTPGSSTANLCSLPFDKLPRPFYPLDDIESFDDRVTFNRE